MQIVKPLHLTPLYRTFSYRGQPVFACGTVLGFRLTDGQPLLEMDVWKAVSARLGRNQVFDAAMPKARPEVLVHGRFHAPGGKPVTAGKASFALAEIHKQLAVFGDRYWSLGMPTGPEPFTDMPLDPSRAFGGAGHALNPAGKGWGDIDTPEGKRRPLPNVEDPRRLIGSPGDAPPPAGFGPLDQTVPPRADRRGTYDDAWRRERAPGLPDDIDWTFFNDAAEDQWRDSPWQGGEPFELSFMHPEYSQLRGRLPSVRGRCFVELRRQGQVVFEELAQTLETVHFFPDQNLGVLIFRTSTAIERDDLDEVVRLLLAFEDLSETPRSLAHYQEALRLRADPEEGFKHHFNTAPLIPASCVCGFQSLQQEHGPPLEQLGLANGQQRLKSDFAAADAKLAEARESVREQLTRAGVDPAPYLAKLEQPAMDPKAAEIQAMVEKALPGAKDGKLDITRVDLKLLEQMFQRVDAMATESRAEALALAEKALREAAASGHVDAKLIDEKIAALRAPPPLPRPQAEATLAGLRENLARVEAGIAQARAQGLEDERLNGIKLDLAAVETQMRSADAQFAVGYRMGAHLMPQGLPPHHGREAEVAAALVAAHRAGQSAASGDYAAAILAGRDLCGVDLREAYLEDADLSGAKLDGADLRGAVLARAKLDGASLRNAQLQGANLGAASIKGADFSGAVLAGAILSHARIEDARFIGCDLTDVQWMDTAFARVDFSQALLPKATLIERDLRLCVFRGANLTAATFIKPKLDGADFSQAMLDETTWVEAKAAGSRWSGASLFNARFVSGADLSQADFGGARMERANLGGVDLTSANLSQAYLPMAWFGGAKLVEARLTGAYALRSQFVKADLEAAECAGANFKEASLRQARLVKARLGDSNLYAVDFEEATLGQTDFTGANLERSILRDWRPS